MSVDLLYQSLLLHFGCSCSIGRLRHHLLLIGCIRILTTTWLMIIHMVIMIATGLFLVVKNARVLHVARFWHISVELLLGLLATWARRWVSRCTVLLVTYILLTRYVFSHRWILWMGSRRGALWTACDHLFHSSVLHVWSLDFGWHLASTWWSLRDSFLTASGAGVGGILSL